MKKHFFILATLSLLPTVLYAQEASQPFVPLTTLPGITDFVQTSSIPSLLNAIYKIAVGAAAALAVLQIMRAGILYMGGDSVTEKREAKNLLAMSIGGLVLVLSPVILFSIINPSILSLQIGLDGISHTTGSASNDAAVNQSASEVCSAAYTDPKAVASTAANACSSLGSGYVGAPNVCCSSSLSAGSTCCAKQSSSTAGTVVQVTSDVINMALSSCGISLTDKQKGCVVGEASYVGQGLSSCTETPQTCSAAVGKALLDACVPNVTGEQRICVYAAFAKAATK